MKPHLTLLLLLCPAAAQAGVAPGAAFGAGFAHPFLGPDHWLAMLAIGWLAARLPRRLAWLPPAGFVFASLLGGLLAFRWPAWTGMEWGIAFSVFSLGLALLAGTWLSGRARVSVACVLAMFGLAHGYAHVIEGYHGEADFFAGFMLATAVLHLGGYGLAVTLARRLAWTQNALGVGMALYGLNLLLGMGA